VVFAEGGASAASESCRLPLSGTARLTVSGPGRFTAGGVDYWVLWVDEEYRTMAIGTPSGSFAGVLNRGATISEDRLRAVRRILEFNGYDLDRLEVE
jgi:apolipoprotein D and lipocalin family protein